MLIEAPRLAGDQAVINSSQSALEHVDVVRVPHARDILSARRLRCGQAVGEIVFRENL